MPDITQVIQQPAVISTVVSTPAPIVSTLVVGQGPAGPAATGISRTSSIAIGGHRLVASIAGDIVYADATILSHRGRLVGLTLSAASAGVVLDIRGDGEITEPSWAWTVDQPVYLGTNGLLTQTVPIKASAQFLQRVGFAVAATRIFLSIEPPIVL